MTEKTGFSAEQHARWGADLLEIHKQLAGLQVDIQLDYDTFQRRPARLLRLLRDIDAELGQLRSTLDECLRIDRPVDYRPETYAGEIDADERRRRQAAAVEPVGLHRADIYG